jgi:type II secretory ATPase GspE/PulE/Tfp pilus assembly ATPase PilB-like protein
MKALTTDQSAVQIVDSLVRLAVDREASDIHLEPTAEGLRVRLRLDGILHDQDPIDKSIMPQIISRLKVMANMNIAEKRVPQDGKFHFKHKGKPIDVRVSTFPSLFHKDI